MLNDVSHVNVVKAQLQFEQRSRDLQNAKLATEQAQLTLDVLLFPDLDQNFTVVDDLSTVHPLASWSEVKALSLERNPELQSAQASVREAQFATTVARYGYLPALGLTFYYGIDANQFAAQASNVSGVNRSTLPNGVIAQRQNLGYAGQITLDIPVWNWGATRSRVRQSELQAKQAQFNLTFAQRRLYANLHSLYDQAATAEKQVSSLQRSRDLAAENLLHLPSSIRIEYGGTFQTQQNSFSSLMVVLLIGLVLVFLLLLFEFKNLSAPTAILSSAILSTAGVFLALLITGTTFNISSFMGLIMVIGIVSKNGILLIDADHKARAEGTPPEEAMIEAGRRRLRPIMMTAIAAVAGMAPLAFGSGVLRPLAIAVIGGILISMFLSLIITPAVNYYLTEKRA